MKINTQEVYVSMPWGFIAIKTWNSSELEPMLVLHGTSDNASSFDLLVPLLSPEYHYLCVDLPGHGMSTAFGPGLPLSFMHFITALQRLIEHFGWPSFSVMGHSVGAHMGTVLAASERLKVKRLILLDATVGEPIEIEMELIRCSTEFHETLENEEHFYNRPHLTSYKDAVAKLKNRAFPISEFAAKAMLNRSLVKVKNGYYRREDPRTNSRLKAHFSADGHLYNISTIRCPVLVIYARQSLMNVVHESSFHQNILELLLKTHTLSKVEYVEGDHCVHCNKPDIVAPVINDFLDATKKVDICFGKSKI